MSGVFYFEKCFVLCIGCDMKNVKRRRMEYKFFEGTRNRINRSIEKPQLEERIPFGYSLQLSMRAAKVTFPPNKRQIFFLNAAGVLFTISQS
jgi:hypothetical protein